MLTHLVCKTHHDAAFQCAEKVGDAFRFAWQLVRMIEPCNASADACPGTLSLLHSTMALLTLMQPWTFQARDET